jgi:hypothetical protein
VIQEVFSQLTSDRLPATASDIFTGLRSPDALAGDGARLGWVEGRRRAGVRSVSMSRVRSIENLKYRRQRKEQEQAASPAPPARAKG